MSKKKILIISLSILAALLLAVLTFYVIRNINEKPPVVVDQSAKPSSNENSQPTAAMVYTGTLSGVDAVHWAQGTITITGNKDAPTLSFKEDFKVARGPDLYVYLSPNAANEELGEFASLGKLKANDGVQEYILPANYKDYKTIVIWCRAFGVTFATAEFDFS